MAIGIRLAPRAGTQVAFGLDPSAPDRFLVRGRVLQPSGALALLALVFLAPGRLALVREGEWLLLALASLLAWSAIAVALVRRRLVLDRGRGLLPEEFGLLFPFARRARPLAAFRRVLVSADNQPGSEGRQTVYPVDLDASAGAAPRLRVDSAGLWEGAMPLAESLSRFLELPLRDERRRGELDHDRLDVAFRERGDQEPRLFPPKRPRCTIEVERPYLFRAHIPRPAVPQTLLLNGGVVACSLLPLAFEVLIPLLRDSPWGPHASWGCWSPGACCRSWSSARLRCLLSPATAERSQRRPSDCTSFATACSGRRPWRYRPASWRTSRCSSPSWAANAACWRTSPRACWWHAQIGLRSASATA